MRKNRKSEKDDDFEEDEGDEELKDGNLQYRGDEALVFPPGLAVSSAQLFVLQGGVVSLLHTLDRTRTRLSLPRGLK